jgi:hypothetical protein
MVYLIGEGPEAMAYARALLSRGDTLAGVACPVWDALYVLAADLGVPWWDIPVDGETHGMIPEGTDRIARVDV